MSLENVIRLLDIARDMNDQDWVDRLLEERRKIVKGANDDV